MEDHLLGFQLDFIQELTTFQTDWEAIKENIGDKDEIENQINLIHNNLLSGLFEKKGLNPEVILHVDTEITKWKRLMF